ncbi:MAG: YciI family protein [Nitrospira sp.]|nr:YciI family protein [Nitrospira sp.]
MHHVDLRTGRRLIGEEWNIQERRNHMRFLVLMIPGVYQPNTNRQPKANFTPTAEMMAKMGRFNEELKQAGALLSLDGLQPLATGARLAFSNGKASVTDGPAVDAKEVVGGFWMLQATSKQQVIDWMTRCPALDGDVIEIRQVFELSDFQEDVQATAKKHG